MNVRIAIDRPTMRDAHHADSIDSAVTDLVVPGHVTPRRPANRNDIDPLIVVSRVRDEVADRARSRLPLPAKPLACALGMRLVARVGTRQRTVSNRVHYDLTRADHHAFIARACARHALRMFATRAELATIDDAHISRLAVMLCGSLTD